MLGGICDYLKQSSRVTSICVASFADDWVTGIERVVRLPRPSPLRKVFNAVWHSILCQAKSLQESLFWNPTAHKRLTSLVQDFQPDLVLYDTVRTGQYRQGEAKGDSHSELIYMDDLFSIRYDKMLHAMDEHPETNINAMGNFANNIPAFAMYLYERSAPLQRWLLRIERRLVAASEDRVPAQFERAFLVSSAERLALTRRANAENVFVLPPRLDASKHMRRNWDGRPTFVFLGSLKLAHNTVSIELFLAANMPRLLELIPDIVIVVIGAGARQALTDIAASYPEHIMLRGFVEDIDEVLSQACAMISPLMFGSGVKLKVIDSLRCGTPLISTEVGVEGIQLEGNVGVIVTNNVDDFPVAMLGMLDPVQNAVASEANALSYRTHYSLKAVDQVYDDVLLDEVAFYSLSDSQTAA